MRSVRMTNHARRRCQQRAIREEQMTCVVNFGVKTWERGAVTYRWTRQSARQHPDLTRDLGLDGVCIVVSTDGEAVLTAYRNRGRRRDKDRGRGCRHQTRKRADVLRDWEEIDDSAEAA